MRVALDLDGVLADLQHQMIEETDYTTADFEEWDKPQYNHFMSEASRVWEEHWEDIQPVEPHLDLKTAQLCANHHVDIVTNTAGSDENVTAWLDAHDIHYEELVRPYSQGTDKQHLDYDMYIDDKPGLAGEVSVHYLRDRLWNQSVRGDGKYLYYSYEDSYVESAGPLKVGPFQSDAPWVVRVTGLNDVIYDLERVMMHEEGTDETN